MTIYFRFNSRSFYPTMRIILSFTLFYLYSGQLVQADPSSHGKEHDSSLGYLDFPRNPLSPSLPAGSNHKQGRSIDIELDNPFSAVSPVLDGQFNGKLKFNNQDSLLQSDDYNTRSRKWRIQDTDAGGGASLHPDDVPATKVEGEHWRRTDNDWHRTEGEAAGDQAPPPHGPVRPPKEPYSLSWVREGRMRSAELSNQISKRQDSGSKLLQDVTEWGISETNYLIGVREPMLYKSGEWCIVK